MALQELRPETQAAIDAARKAKIRLETEEEARITTYEQLNFLASILIAKTQYAQLMLSLEQEKERNDNDWNKQ
jgi:hypothetical protein